MNTFTLKLVAVFCMTLDHVNKIGDLSIPAFSIIGRIAAPIFVFCSVWAMYYTKSQKKYVLRLYSLSVCMELLKIWMGWKYDYSVSSNIFRTLFVLSLCIYVLDNYKKYSKGKVLAGLFTYHAFLMYITTFVNMLSYKLTDSTRICDFLYALFGSISNIEGGFLVLLGIGFYFFKDSKYKLSTFYIGFCTFVFCNSMFAILPSVVSRLDYHLGELIGRISFILVETLGFSAFPTIINVVDLFTFDYQWLMILALPFIYLYNHKKGPSLKYFFYIYYPLHILILVHFFIA